MKKIIKLSFLFSIVALLESCAVSLPIAISDNPVGTKVGKSSYTSFFGFPPLNGDASIQTAAKEAGITKVATVDRRVTSGIFTVTVTKIVTGE